MSYDWRELLDRALEGEALSAPEAEALAAALASDERREEALALVCFEGQLRQRLSPPAGEGAALSRERLLAKATLREKARWLRAGRRGPRRAAVVAAAAAALLLAALGWLLTRGARGYPEPEATGDYRVLGDEAGFARGQRLAVGPGGARLSLGGYCALALDPNTRVVVRGKGRDEAVELERGRIVSRVDPGKGRFTLLTPLGPIEVRGTEFITSVEYPESQKGESDMGTLKKSAVVTVVVLSGVVACHLGEVAVLEQGMSQVFAGGERATLPAELKGFKGILVGTITSEVTREFNLKIEKIATVWPESKAEAPERAVGKTIEIVVGQNRMLEQHLHTLKGLRKGDRVIAEAFDVQGFRLTVMELFRKAEESGERPEGEGEVREKKTRHEGEGEVREKKVRREGEGEGEVREKKVRREGEGEGEVREKKVRREGEGEWREKKTEPRTEGMRELEGWVKATPDRDCAGILKVVERVQTEEGVREKAVVYRIVKEGEGEKLVREANGRRVRLAGVVTPAEEGVEPGIVVKKFRIPDAPDEPKREKPERRDGEGEVREKKVRTEGEGEVREKKVRHEGEGEPREEKRTEPRGEATGPAAGDAIEGFRGMLEGILVGKGEDTFVLRVEKVGKVWQSSTAKKPEGLVGKTVTISLKGEPRAAEAIVQALADLRAGDRVLVGAAHREGSVLRVVEVLRKVQAE